MTAKLVRAALGAAVLGAGCAQIISFPDYHYGVAGGGGAGGKGGSGGRTTATGGTAGNTVSSSSGVAGQGGSGGNATGGTGGTGGSMGGTGGSVGGAGGGDGGVVCTPDAGGVCDELCDADHPCTGKCVWCTTLGDGAPQHARGVAIAPDGDVVFAADTTSLAFVGGTANVPGGYALVIAKLDKATGAKLWSVNVGEGADAGVVGGHDARAVAVDASGNTYVVGSMTTGLTSIAGVPLDLSAAGGGAAPDILIVKLGVTGDVIWAKAIGSAGADVAADIAVAPDGTLWMTGSAGGQFTGLAGAPPWSAGALVLHLDQNGGYIYGKTLPNVTGLGIAVDQLGNVAVAGQVSAPDDSVALLRVDTAEILSSKSFGDTAAQRGKGVAFDQSGNLFLVAEAQGTLDFQSAACPPLTPTAAAGPLGGTDIVVARFAPNGGACQWAKRFSKTGTDTNQLKTDNHPVRIVADSVGNVIFNGLISNGTTDFGGSTQMTAGAPYFSHAVVKLRGTDGSTVWARSSQIGSNGGIGIGLAARDGAVVMCGGHNLSTNFGCGPVNSAGALDIDVTLLHP